MVQSHASGPIEALSNIKAITLAKNIALKSAQLAFVKIIMESVIQILSDTTVTSTNLKKNSNQWCGRNMVLSASAQAVLNYGNQRV